MSRNSKLKEAKIGLSRNKKLDDARRLRGIYFNDPEDRIQRDHQECMEKIGNSSGCLAMPCKKRNSGSEETPLHESLL